MLHYKGMVLRQVFNSMAETACKMRVRLNIAIEMLTAITRLPNSGDQPHISQPVERVIHCHQRQSLVMLLNLTVDLFRGRV